MISVLTPCACVSRPNSLRRGLAGVSLLSLLFGISPAAEPGAGRLTGTFEGIECEYSPGREALAQLLAHRFAAHNQGVAVALAAEKTAPAPVVPLSPAEMRANRAAYLGGITAQLALSQPTPLQEECYDEFLRNYDQYMTLYGMMRDYMATFQVIKRFTVWDREELIHRLGAREKIAGFTYDPVTKQGNASFGFSWNGQDDRFKDLFAKREKLSRDYRMSIGQENGRSVYRGSVSSKKPVSTPPAATASQPAETDKASELLPVIIPTDLTNIPPDDLAQKLWDGRDKDSLVTMLENISKMGDNIPSVDPTLAFVVLHETTELGILDRYYRGPDRRWFCDGVANYVPWRVVNDLHGGKVAATVYNLPEQLSHFAPLREQADLRKWPAAENQTDGDQHTELNSARYAFAAQAVFLMNERGGPNLLPRLFAEIGKTKPAKVSIKTVEKAWQKLTGTKLDTILADAVKPMSAPAKPAG